MTQSALKRCSRSWLLWLILAAAALPLRAAGYAGLVTFAGAPVPGATVTAHQDDQRIVTTTDEQGVYRFADLPDGNWTIEVEMLGFAAARVDVAVAPGAMPEPIALTLRPFDELTREVATARAETVVAAPIAASPTTAPTTAANGSGAAAAPPPSAAPADAPADPMGAADGLLINGSVNNGAASPFAQSAAFGNNRNGRRSLYNGGIGAVFGSSAWDARPVTFTGQPTATGSYSDVQFLSTFGGPLKIPGVRNRPNVFGGYQRNVDHQASTESALVPSLLERAGDFSQTRDAFGRPVAIVDPLTGVPFGDNTLPQARLSPEALALLAYYPKPNLEDQGRSYFQTALVTRTQQDSGQARVNHSINTRNSLFGTFAYQRIATDTPSLFGFTDAARTTTMDGTVIWSRRFSQAFTTQLRYQLTRNTNDVTPQFANQVNVSGAAGILGNDQSPANWGPPALSFSSGLLRLADGQFNDSTTLTNGVLGELRWSRPRHNISMGIGARRIQHDIFAQQNARGSFAFTGDASGYDVADFLLGLPHASSIAFGNADKFLRGNAYEAYITDDWRLSPGLTLNLGVRWEYESPLTERLGRLVNLDVAPNFTAIAGVTGASTTGALSGERYPSSLLQSDPRGIQPRLAFAWRPIAGSSLVVRGGYGIYRNTNTYQPIALLMAQQPPFSKSLTVESTPGAPLTLRNGFPATADAPASTFGVDPDFRVGDAQNWQLSMQRDLPASLTVLVNYLGSYGRNLMQEFLPNTYPVGGVNPCPACPSGFVYLTSSGSSMRHAGQFQVRRRLRNGLTATAQYTLAKATDNAGAFTGASLGGTAIAQDWRDLEAERGPSNFDQRHLFTATVQYTTGVGVTGGGLLTGLKGALVKGWTITSNLSAGSGLPLTPVYFANVPGTGITGTLRPQLTGASTDAPDGLYANPLAYALPSAGTWGNAGRNSITGPSQFSMSAGIARTFPWGDRMNLDWRLDATNVLNRVTIASVNTVVGSPQFGLPTRANPMRKVQTTLRLRF